MANEYLRDTAYTGTAKSAWARPQLTVLSAKGAESGLLVGPEIIVLFTS